MRSRLVTHELMALGRGLQSLIPNRTTVHHATADTRTEPASAQAHPVVASSVSAPAKPSGAPLQVALTQIDTNPEQPRKVFTHQALEELIASIKEHGILQPLIVSEKPDGRYELIAGERRMRAAQMLQLLTVPAVVRATKDNREKLELALIENIQRADLNAIEEALAYERLASEFGLSHEEIAQQVGKSRSAVTNTMRLLQLPAHIQQALVDGKISMGKARALLSIDDAHEQDRVFTSMMGEGITVRDVERAAQQAAVHRPGKGNVRRDPNLLDQENELRKKFGTKVRITKRGERGKIEIEYYSDEEYQQLMHVLLA